MAADLCSSGDGLLDEDAALGEVVGHGCCGAELTDGLGMGDVRMEAGVGAWRLARTAMAIFPARAASCCSCRREESEEIPKAKVVNGREDGER